MKPFDPKKRRGSDDQRSSYRSGNSFHRDDSRNSDSDTLSDFTRDKRPRVNRERKFGTDERPQGSRHSFNPNFTRDNRLKRDDNERPQSYRSSYERSRQEGERNDTARPSRDFRSSRSSEGSLNYRNSESRFRRSEESGSSRYNKEDRPQYRHYNHTSDSDRRDNNPREDRNARYGAPRNNDRSDRSDRSDFAPKRSYGRDEGFRKSEGFRGEGDSRRSEGFRSERGFRKPEGFRSEGDSRRSEGFRGEKSFHKSEGFRRDEGFRKSGEHRSARPEGGFRKGPRRDKEAYPRFDAPKPVGAIRLNRFIANSGICSRREADDLITAGVVSINGVVVSELGTKVNPTDEVRFNGELIKGEKKVYILMNKPKGFVTSVEDPHSDKTVMDLLRNACTERIYPVGRLDKNSVGVLLFTNDGELTRQLTHPSYNKRKVYQVLLDKVLTEQDMTKIAEGVTLEDGVIFADEISYVDDSRKEVGIEIHSGRNRIVRRIFESLGYGVQKLDRVYFAGLTKQRLKRGGWRFLTPKEVSMLKSGEYE